MIGRVLEKYRILDKIGQGGMAIVYRGIDETLGREVAVKVLHPHLAEMEESRLRLQREAQAVAKLRHENILEIFAYSGLDSPDSYIVTEYIHGQTLKEFLKDHPIPHPEVAAMIVHQICRALRHAHSLGVIHRDIKPENVMIRNDGVLKLTDFGIAQIIDRERMTITGQLLGSPAYMAPEQVEGKPADNRSDVFSVGILLYQLATGEIPFRGKNPHEVLKKIADCRFVDPEVACPAVGARLARIISRALQRAPDDRFGDIDSMLEELQGYLEEIGVDDPRPELAAFFADSEKFAKEFRPRLVRALTKAGEQALAAKKQPRALELFNRVLTIEPRNERVTRLLARLTRRRMATRVGVYLALGLAGLVAVVLAVTLVPWSQLGQPGGTLDGALSGAAGADASVGVPLDGGPRGAEASMGPATMTAVSTTDAASAIGDAGPARPDAGARRRLIKPLRKTPTPPVMASRQVTLRVLPAAAVPSLSLDGRAMGPYRGGKLALGPGAHRLTVRAPSFFDARVPIAAGDRRKVIPVSLRWKPAQVIVRCSATGAVVRLRSGSTTKDSLPGAALAMPVPATSASGEFTVEVTVSAPGYRSASTTVTVRAGRTRTVTVPLRKGE